MHALPTLELLERHHDFPGPYMFKVIGAADNALVSRVVAAVREGLDGVEDPPYHVRESSGGKHLAITLEPLVSSPERVLAVYAKLKLVAGIFTYW